MHKPKAPKRAAIRTHTPITGKLEYLNINPQNTMSIIKYLNRIKRIDKLIRMKATGSPLELSLKLGISQSVLFDTLSDMKKLGAPIAYSKDNGTYYYQYDVESICSFSQILINVKQ
jgi:hypothetical protein